jgi:hypothetical protein
MTRVHGGEHKSGIVITKDHTEGLGEMDKLSEFAPLHVSLTCRAALALPGSDTELRITTQC